MTKTLALACLLSLLVGGVASAESRSSANTTKIWRAQDECTKKAFKQYPDYTPESNAKREQARRLCLATGNLPPRASAPVPGAPADGGAAH